VRVVLWIGFALWISTAGTVAAPALKSPPPKAPRHRINMENFQRIKEGMTKAEVESLFGVPAGNYDDGPNDFFDQRPEKERQAAWADNGGAPTDWGSNGFIAHVWFDENDKARHWIYHEWVPVQRPMPNNPRWHTRGYVADATRSNTEEAEPLVAPDPRRQ
jgi:hypothetical protein